MSGLLSSIVEFFAFSSLWELFAVLLALAYLLLAVRRNLWCWLAALISSAIYLALMWQVKLYMQTALQVFYVGMAIYGYLEWRRGRDAGGQVVITRWSAATHVWVMGSVLAVSALNGWLLERSTDAAWPYLDAFVTWGSVVTTVMVARRVIENWLYWIVVDGVAAFVYFRQGLNPTALLFIVYIGIVIHGFWVWRREARSAEPVKAVSS